MVDPRIDHLRRLIARLQEAPGSVERDTLLRAARARIVSIETGQVNVTAWPGTPTAGEPTGGIADLLR